MSSRTVTAAGRMHEHPPPKAFSSPERSFNQPDSSAPNTRADLVLSAHRSRDTPLKHTSVQRLNQSFQPAPSPELPSHYQSTYFPPSNHGNFRYQNLRPPPPSSEVLSPNPIQPADHLPAHIPFAITNESTRRYNQNTKYQVQVPSASGSSQPSPQVQIAALPLSHEGSLPFRYLPSVPYSNQYSSASSSKLRSHERYRASPAGFSGAPSTLTNSVRWQASTPPSPNYPDIPSDSDESALELSDGSKPKGATRVPIAPSESFVFPSGRSAAHPAKPSKSKSPKISKRSSEGSNANSGCLRIIRKFFKKDKGKNTSPERRISEESSYAYIVHHERTTTLKSSYPLNPYNSDLLNNDRLTGELLSRLNRTGSPSFHDYATPPSSVLDLGCGQGHWVLEAAIAWEAYGTHVTGYDMVDISSKLLRRASESVRDNIQFVEGNFLKEQLPFKDDTFDLVRMSCLALCITSDSWGFILREVRRVLVVGGRLEFIDDQIFLPFGKESSLMEGHHDGPDHEAVGVSTHGPKGKAREQLNPSIVPSPEAWDRSLSIYDLDALFERMLLDTFDIFKDPSDFILPLMTKIFDQAQEVETMNLVLAPPNSRAMSRRSSQQGPSHYPGLILWPSTLIRMDHSEVEIHASRHLRTFMSCKNFLAQYAIKVAELEGERFDEESVLQALWTYESFLQHKFNPPVPASGSSVMPNELTLVRTFRVFEAVKTKKNWA